jgi:hypothetical protein
LGSNGHHYFIENIFYFNQKGPGLYSEFQRVSLRIQIDWDAGIIRFDDF